MHTPSTPQVSGSANQYWDDWRLLFLEGGTHPPEPEHIAYMEELLTFVAGHEVLGLLIDARPIGRLSPEMSDWVSNQYLPELAATTLRYIAVVAPVDPFAMMETERWDKRCNELGICNEIFNDKNTASFWIKPQLAPLLKHMPESDVSR